MLNIYKIPVPTPYTVGTINSYLIKNEPYTLLDTGPNTDEAKRVLTEELHKLGVELSDIKRVALTHSHLDHSGLVPWLQKISGAQVYINRLEIRKILPAYDFYLERLAFLQEAGLPTDAFYEILGDFDPVGDCEPLNPDAVFLNEGDPLIFNGGALTAMHMPGHSEGLMCFYDEEGGSFFAGDFILKMITPNPSMEPDPEDYSRRLPTLKLYLAGLSRLEALNPRLILPGHGGNITDGKTASRKVIEHHMERLQYTLDILQNKSLTVYQLMREFYPSIEGFEIYLGISEVYAHVDYLVLEGKAIKENAGAFSLFHAV